MIKVGEKAKIKVQWNVLPYDYTQEKVNEIKSLVAKKYGKSKDDVDVIYKFITPDDNDEDCVFSRKTVAEIQNPENHKELFKKYLEQYHKGEYDMDIIESIDNEINSKIDYEVFDKYRKFSIKWVKWSNFESYGGDNSFDFTTLRGLVLLNGEPANQSGKTTFAVDLLHFILFGKSGKYSRLEDLFNNTLPEETQLCAEACISIDGCDYIIKRTLTRPALEKRTSKSRTTQKAEFYRKIGDTLEELSEYVEENGQDVRETNKIIREAIGNEKDFDLMMCITGKNLDALIDDTPTNRGVLLSRWIGLLPLEEKFKVANDRFKELKQNLTIYKYNREDLNDEIAAFNEELKIKEKENSDLEKSNKKLDVEIKELEDNQTKLTESKKTIDKDIMSLDITTLEKNITDTKEEGKKKRAEFNENKKKIDEIGEVDFSKEEYDAAEKEKNELVTERANIGADYKLVRSSIDALKKGEFCPTCGAKLKDVDNSKKIKEKEIELEELANKGKGVADRIKKLEEKIESMKKNKENYDTLNKLNASQSALSSKIELLLKNYENLTNKKKKYNENSEAIDQNNKLDIEINLIKGNLKTKREIRDKNLISLSTNKANVKTYTEEKEKREKILKDYDKDENLNRNWKIYLEMVGKDGVTKMILREMLPVVNEIISQLLDDVCDFSVNVDINTKNEVTFNLIRNGLVQTLDSGSGFERTASALALRSALSRVSTISRMNFLVFDEILGRVANVNYDNMRLLYERILEDYDFIFNITHIEDVRDWHEHIVTVTKTNGVSSLQQIRNTSKKVEKVIEKQPKKRVNKKSTKTTKK